MNPELEILKAEILQEGIAKRLDDIHDWLNKFFYSFSETAGKRDLRKFEIENYLRQEGLLGFCQFEIRFNDWKKLNAICNPEYSEKELDQKKFSTLKPIFSEAVQKFLDGVQKTDTREHLFKKLSPFYSSLILKQPATS
jgi:hypothetical protein